MQGVAHEEHQSIQGAGVTSSRENTLKPPATETKIRADFPQTNQPPMSIQGLVPGTHGVILFVAKLLKKAPTYDFSSESSPLDQLSVSQSAGNKLMRVAHTHTHTHNIVTKLPPALREP